ncbi:DoxX family protein [Nonomuraea terrae]|uniref:DoxX family protein n=1 Tax=Nonomuraea terrae TaxID=2530383 RepID=A0A4R4YTM9_9ACTN|nr:DoxX family protein [Nonomuraea terrae]TDD48698.1 DoxX family protein [Nonomuraea terrae]
MVDQARPVVLLLARIAIGVIFLVHGYHKFATTGIGGTIEFFQSVGIPLAALAAPAVAVLEVTGGLALILGAALPLAGTLLALTMAGAIVFVHAPNGFGAEDGGYEFVLALAAASLAVGFSGGGAFALDRVLVRRRGPVTATA